MTNCPNCGAVITGYRCEYCDTVFSESLVEEDELCKLVHDYSKGLDERLNYYNELIADMHRLEDKMKFTFDIVDFVIIASGILAVTLVLLGIL